MFRCGERVQGGAEREGDTGEDHCRHLARLRADRNDAVSTCYDVYLLNLLACSVNILPFRLNVPLNNILHPLNTLLPFSQTGS